jgi:hypothetical protein
MIFLRTAIIILIFIAQFAEIRDTRKVIDMPRGHADYNAPTYATSTYDLDVGKLLAFYHGFVPLDTRGRVAYINTFGQDYREIDITGSIGVTWEINAEEGKTFAGGTAIKFTLPAGDKFGKAAKLLTLAVSGRKGLEVAYGSINSDVMPQIRITGGNPEGVNKWGEVRVNAATDTWQYYDSSKNWQDIEGAEVGADNNLWGRAKLVIDLDTGEYVRFMVNGVDYDLSGLAMPDYTVSSPYYQEIAALAQNQSGVTGGSLFFGYMLATVDEP